MNKQLNNKNKEAAAKVWLGEDGIVRMEIGNIKWSNEILEKMAKDYENIVKSLPEKPNIIIDTSNVQYAGTTTVRKKGVEHLRTTVKSPGWKKLAMWGGSTVVRVAISFLVTATHMDNVKQFKTEKEALEWLEGE